MKIQILSDLHNEFFKNKSPPDIEQTDADVVVLAGDIWTKGRGVIWAIEQSSSLGKPIVYTLGNHEYYGTHTRHIDKCKAMAEGTDVHILERDVQIIGDTRFLGSTLWSDFAIKGNGAEKELAMFAAREKVNDYRVIRVPPSYKKLHPKDTLAWHKESVAWLRDKLDEPFGGKTVMVSHHAPHLKSDPWINNLTPAYLSDLSALMDGERLHLWVHGHTHIAVDYEVYGTRVASNPRGYPGVEPVDGYDPKLVVDV